MEAAAKKQQNIMPLWHLRSTITDDLTALGIMENAQNAAAHVPGPSNLDESLKGLGKVVPSSSKDPITIEDEEDEDAKPGAAEGNEADCKGGPCPVAPHTDPLSFIFKDYDQYYASLAASTAPSAQHTPPGEFSVLGDFEEDRKPSIEYLDSLNEHNKRSRSVEDAGESERKLARVGDGWGQQGAQENGEVHMNGAESSGVDAEDLLAEDPIVYGLFSLHLFYAMLKGFSFQWMANKCRSPKLVRSTTI